MKLKTLLSAIVFFALPIVALAQDTKETLIQELYRKSGLEKQVDQLPMFIQLGFDQAVAADNRLNGMPQSVIAEMRGSVKTVFASQRIKETIVTELREKLTIGDLKNVLRWLSSPIGRKFTQLEESASTAEKYHEMQRYALQLQKSPPLPARLKIIQQLDSAVKATQTSVEVAMNTQLAVAIAVAASLPREQQPTYDVLVSTIEQSRSQIESTMRAETLVSLLFIYDTVPSAEINRYISFASSPAGTRYHDAAMSGLKQALTRAGYKWGETVADILKQSGSKSEA